MSCDVVVALTMSDDTVEMLDIPVGLSDGDDGVLELSACVIAVLGRVVGLSDCDVGLANCIVGEADGAGTPVDCGSVLEGRMTGSVDRNVDVCSVVIGVCVVSGGADVVVGSVVGLTMGVVGDVAAVGTIVETAGCGVVDWEVVVVAGVDGAVVVVAATHAAFCHIGGQIHVHAH